MHIRMFCSNVLTTLLPPSLSSLSGILNGSLLPKVLQLKTLCSKKPVCCAGSHKTVKSSPRGTSPRTQPVLSPSFLFFF